MHAPATLLLLGTTLLAATGCGRGGSAAAAPERGPITAVRLVDSTTAEIGGAELPLFRVEVRTAARTDTLERVLAAEVPQVIGDTLLLGFGYDSGGQMTTAFRWEVRTGSVAERSLPRDLRGGLTRPAFAPDGRHLAYVVFPGDGTARGVVRSWPGQRVVRRGDPVEVPATDQIAGVARWEDAETFLWFIELEGAGELWVRQRGSTARRGTTSDTVRTAAVFE